jgi:hypothetical protein
MKFVIASLFFPLIAACIRKALKIYRALDALHLRHATARKTREYIITLPPDSSSRQDFQGEELGVWFEAVYEKNEIIVKGTKRGKFSYTSNIQVGDQLLKVGEIKVESLTFEETMKLIKEKLTALGVAEQRKSVVKSTPNIRSKSIILTSEKSTEAEADSREYEKLTLTFRTFEERLRRERSANSCEDRRQTKLDKVSNSRSERMATVIPEVDAISVEISAISNTLFFTVKPFDIKNPPFFVENRSSIHTIYFRQRQCDGHPWTELPPGATIYFMWEDNLKPKKLTVRVGRLKALKYKSSFEVAKDSKKPSRIFSRGDVANFIPKYVHLVESEEQSAFGPSRTIKLEEIGFVEMLPCPSADERNSTSDVASLLCRVDTKGETRILVVSDCSDASGGNEKSILLHHVEILTREILDEGLKLLKFRELEQGLKAPTIIISSASGRSRSPATLPNDVDLNPAEVKKLESQIIDIADYPESTTIMHKNQVIVEIIEAVGLNAADISISGLCNPYCEVKLKNSTKASSRGLFSKQTVRRTYYIEKTLSPKWCEQKFVFNVPENASDCLRGYSVAVKVKSFGFLGVDLHLGQTDVQLYNLRNQSELVGWFPLKNNTGESSVGHTCGSIRMRLQWIYTMPALLNYFVAFSDSRLKELTKRRENIQQKLSAFEGQSKVQEYVNQIRWNTFSSLGLPTRSKNMSKPFPGGSLPEKRPKQQSSALRRNYLGSLHLQTLQSKRKRILSYSTKDSSLHKELTSEEIGLGPLQRTGERNNLEEADQLPLSRLQDGWRKTRGNRTRASSDMSHNRFHNTVNTKRGEFLFDSKRKLSDMTDEILHPMLYPKVMSLPPVAIQSFGFGISNVDNNEATLLKETDQTGRIRFLTANEFSFSSQSSSCEDDELLSNDECLQLLFKRGLLYHEPGWSFRRPHWKPLSDIDNTVSDNQDYIRWGTKSSILFNSWLEVHNFFNTSCSLGSSTVYMEKSNLIGGNAFSLKESSSQIREQGCHFRCLFRLPQTAPNVTKKRFEKLSSEMTASQNSTFSLYKRLLRSCSSSGGWLSIRPIMALNLPGNNTMRVKLKYGTLTRMSKPVNAPVNPSWAEDIAPNGTTDERVQLRLRFEGSSYPSYPDKLKYQDPDFHLYVEPLKTCGLIRLSVVGGNMNSEIEFGVLNIPIESALQCCIDDTDASALSHSCNRQESQKTYVRWFPLRDPKDCMPVEGDMGLSFLSPESEKATHQEFSSYTPCIKLAFLWDPEFDGEPDVDDSGGVAPCCSSNSNDHTNGVRRCDLMKTFFYADVKGISASLIDSTRAIELLSLTLERLVLRYFVTETKTRISATIGWIQIDHHNNEAREAVVVAPRLADNLQPALVISTMKDNLRSKKKIDTYEFVAFALQELDIRLDEVLLNDCWIFFLEYVRKLEVRKQVVAGRFNAWAQITSLFIDNNRREHVLMDKKKLYIEKLMLADMKFNLSYIKGFPGASLRQVADDFDEQHRVMVDAKGRESNELQNEEPIKWAVRQPGNAVERDVEIFHRLSEQESDGDFRYSSRFVYNLPSVISAVFPAISEAPIRLQGKIMDHVFESIGDIVASVKNYYASEALRQVYRIIGSLEVLGAPLDVFSHFATGVKDFFYEPSKAFMIDPMNPTLVGLGVAKGTLSLVSHSATGFFGFASKMISSGGYAAAALSLDNTYLQRRAKFIEIIGKFEDSRSRPKSAKFAIAVARPFMDLLFGVTDAAAGVFLEPYKGARKEGALGLIKGASIGMVGVVAKPLAGVLDAFAHTAESITMFAKEVNILEKRFEPILKRRIPHPFGLHGSLRFFRMETARSAELLRMFPVLEKEGKQSDEARVDEVVVWVEVFHMAPGLEVYIIVSNHRIASINLRIEETGHVAPTLNWHVILKGDVPVTSRLENNGHGMFLYVCQQLTLADKSSLAKAKDSKHMISSVAETLRFETLLKSPTEGDLSKVITSPPGSRRLMGGTFPALRRSGKKCEAVVYTLYGEFHQRSQLLRIHNAISCINQNYEEVVHESGLGPEWNKDGITTFGPYEFSDQGIRSRDGPEILPFHKSNIWWANNRKSRRRLHLLQDSQPEDLPMLDGYPLISCRKGSGAPEPMGSFAEVKPSSDSAARYESLSHQKDSKINLESRSLEGREQSVEAAFQYQQGSSRIEATASYRNDLNPQSCPSEILMVDRGDLSQVVSTIESEAILARLRQVEFLLEQLLRSQNKVQAKPPFLYSSTPVAVDESRETNIISNLSNDKFSTSDIHDFTGEDKKGDEVLRVRLL